MDGDEEKIRFGCGFIAMFVISSGILLFVFFTYSWVLFFICLSVSFLFGKYAIRSGDQAYDTLRNIMSWFTK